MMDDRPLDRNLFRRVLVLGFAPREWELHGSGRFAKVRETDPAEVINERVPRRSCPVRFGRLRFLLAALIDISVQCNRADDY